MRERWSDIEEWATASIRAARGGGVDSRLERLTSDGGVTAVLTGEEVSQGGALVPDELMGELQVLPSLYEAALSERCTPWQMRSNTRKVPAMYSADHDAGAPFGANVRWESDGADMSANPATPKFADIGLEAKNLNSYIEVNTTFVEDSAVELIDVMTALYSTVVTWKMNQMIIRGRGAGQPLGIIGAPASVVVDRSTNNQIGDADLDEMLSALLPGCAERAVFLAHPTAVGDIIDRAPLRSLSAAVPYLNIYGHRVIRSEHCSVIGTRGDLILADLAAYYVGIRQQVMVAMSGLGSGFVKNQTGVRVTARLDGQPGIVTSVDPAQGSDNQSAFVVLDT